MTHPTPVSAPATPLSIRGASRRSLAAAALALTLTAGGTGHAQSTDQERQGPGTVSKGTTRTAVPSLPVAAPTVTVTKADIIRTIDNILKGAKKGESTVWVGDMGLFVPALKAQRDELTGATKKVNPGALSGKGRTTFGVTSYTSNNYTEPWKSGIVYYKFDDNITPTNRGYFIDACREWEAVANVKFTPWTEGNPSAYVSVHNSGAEEPSHASVGYFVYNGRGGDIYIHDWTRKYTIVHELGHTLGMRHEHQRVDRNTYIEMHPGWVNNDNYKILNLEMQNRTPYDFHSVMHYGPYVGDTEVIKVRAPYSVGTAAPILGQRRYLSEGDKRAMVAVYGPPYAVREVASAPNGSPQVLMSLGFHYNVPFNFLGVLQPFNWDATSAGYYNSFTYNQWGANDNTYCAALSIGGDWVTNLVWAKTDRANLGTQITYQQVWGISGDNTGTRGPLVQTFGPWAGWRFIGIATGWDNYSHILWANDNGDISLWKMDNNRAYQGERTYSPGPNWHAQAIAIGPNNKIYVLWNHSDGAYSVWRLNPHAGWALEVVKTANWFPSVNTVRQWDYLAKDIAVRSDGKVQVLFTDPTGSGLVTTLGADEFNNPHANFFYGPYVADGVRWRPTGLSNGPNGQVFLYSNYLKDNTRVASLWTGWETGSFSGFKDFLF